MNFTRKIDRAMQWAGEKMGAEAKATHSEEFKALETEMDLRHEGMERLHKSMNIYTKWLSRRCDALEDRSRSTPMALLGRNMAAHGADFEQDSELGRCLASMGSANEHIAELQTSYVDCANATWLQQVERNLAMMKEYQSARKKLENRRLAYDATMGKMQKAKKDDFRLEEELRINKTKFDDTTEDVFQRMQDIKDAEVDTVSALNSFLDAELEYHERAADELRRLRQTWSTGADMSRCPSSQGGSDLERIYSNASTRSQSHRSSVIPEGRESSRVPEWKPTRTLSTRAAPPPPPPPPASRPPVLRSATFEARHAPVAPARVSMARAVTDGAIHASRGAEDVFGDDTSTCSGDNSPGWADHGVSPATSYGSLRGNPNNTLGDSRKAPPPPVNRSKKPPPPPVPRKISLGY